MHHPLEVFLREGVGDEGEGERALGRAAAHEVAHAPGGEVRVGGGARQPEVGQVGADGCLRIAEEMSDPPLVQL